MINTNMGRNNSKYRWERVSLKQFTIYKSKVKKNNIKKPKAPKKPQAKWSIKAQNYKLQVDHLGLALENVHVHGICTHSYAYIVHQVYAAVCQAH